MGKMVLLDQVGPGSSQDIMVPASPKKCALAQCLWLSSGLSSFLPYPFTPFSLHR